MFQAHVSTEAHGLLSAAGRSVAKRVGAGTTPTHLQLDRMVAEFVGKEDAITFGMGFATNSVGIPALVGKGCLILSDALNHSSIVAGVRGSGAKVKVRSCRGPRYSHGSRLHHS